MSLRVRTWGFVILLLLAGTLLRILFILHHPDFTGDAVAYADLGHNLFAHHIFGFTDSGAIRATLIRLPGYPAFLGTCFAIFGTWNFIAVIWIQLIVSMVDCCLLGVLACNLMGRRAGLAALALATLCPFTANYCATPLTETWSLFCITLALLSLERWTVSFRRGQPWTLWLLPMAFALAYAVLLRPDQALLAAVVVPAMLWIGFRQPGRPLPKRIVPALIVSLAVALPLLLWGARNWRMFHVFQPLAPRYANDPGQPNPDGFQRWYRTWAIDLKATFDVYWTFDGTPLSFNDLPPRAFDTPAQREQTLQLYQDYNKRAAWTPAIDARFAQLAADRVAAHPFRFYVVYPTLKLADMYLRPRTELLRVPIDWWNPARPAVLFWCLLYALLDATYIALAIVGLYRWRRLQWSGHAPLACAMVAFVILRSALLFTIDNSEPRYTLEFFPIAILLASALRASRKC